MVEGLIVAKNIVMCLDGTNNKLKAAINTNVVRLFRLLDLSDPDVQVGYYDPGVGTFSSPAAWTPAARRISRYAGLLFGAGMRQNLGEAYTYLTNTYQPGDRIFIFGFSRGAYTARALTGMLDVFGIFRPGSDNLVPYAVSAYTKQEKSDRRDTASERERRKAFFEGLRIYANTHGMDLPGRGDGHAEVHFVGLWDTVKAAGNLTRQLRWPFTRQLPHAKTIRHAVAIDEDRRPYREYLVDTPNPRHLFVADDQDLAEVWFAGVHSDVGGMFDEGTRLSDIPLKWMADEAIERQLKVRRGRYAEMAKEAGDVKPTDPAHINKWPWKLLGPGRRTIPDGAAVHASVKARADEHSGYAKRVPRNVAYVDPDWTTRRAKAPA